MTPADAPIEFRTTVRDLVEFVHRRGDLAGEGQFRPANRAVEGTRGHRRLQQSRSEGYKPEVSIERTYERGVLKLHLTGRIDGVMAATNPPLVEEIKTVDGKWSGRADPVHRAQLRIYAALLAEANDWNRVDVCLTYLDLGTDLETPFREIEERADLLCFLDETVNAWLEWLTSRTEWMRLRNTSLKHLAFPFDNFRGGQRNLAAAVYRSIRDRRRLFIEAPTGLGKTLATLYPAAKALPLLGEGQIFYVTAKTPGRHAAEHALDKLRQAGAQLRTISLTAKQKICFSETPAGCDLRTCPYALGYYDRVKPAVNELLALEKIDKTTIETVARTHMVCPFELSLDASLWTDVVIGDFNYVFDPTTQLRRHFAEGAARHVVLVDEAHNLVDRSRDMHSASLSVEELEIPRQAAKGKGLAKAKRALNAARTHLTDYLASTNGEGSILPAKSYHDGATALAAIPKDFTAPLREVIQAMEPFLADQKPGSDITEWLAPWFAIHSFLKAADGFDETCRFIAAPVEGRVTIFCADPAKRLREVLHGLRSTLFFSATFSPMEYFRDLLGGEETDHCVNFPSPFAADQMHLAVADYDVSYKAREASRSAVALAVRDQIARTPGNHLVFCPSLDYLGTLEAELTALGLSVFSQTTTMDEAQRETFLAHFAQGGTTTGLAVLGGIFSEGVDLPGDRLVGVTVIGVGFPRLSLERDILQLYFDQTRGEGFDYAYRFPGMQRVLQAVGRLIRTETDSGSALLIDKRFLEKRYRTLFPEWWQVQRFKSQG